MMSFLVVYLVGCFVAMLVFAIEIKYMNNEEGNNVSVLDVLFSAIFYKSLHFQIFLSWVSVIVLIIHRDIDEA